MWDFRMMAGMVHKVLSAAIVATVAALGIFCPVAGHAQSSDIGTAERVAGRVMGGRLAYPIGEGRKLPFREHIQTATDSASVIRLLDRTTLSLGANAQVVLDEFVYNPDKSIAQGVVQLAMGSLRFVSAAGRRTDVTVQTPAATLGIRGTIFNVNVTPNGTEVQVESGLVEVSNASGSLDLAQGQTAVFGPNRPGQRTAGPSPALTAAIQQIVRLVGDRGAEEKGATQRDAATAVPAPVAAAAQAAAPGTFRHLLMRLATGDVLIRLRPDLAPNSVARVVALAQQGRYDGAAFARVLPGFVAQTGPLAVGPQGPWPAEFTAEPFRSGLVALARGQAPDSADGRLFIVLGRHENMDGRFAVVGEVVNGLPTVERLPPGEPPRQPARIVSLRPSP
jgi:peptidylprolyl isomerase